MGVRYGTEKKRGVIARVFDAEQDKCGGINSCGEINAAVRHRTGQMRRDILYVGVRHSTGQMRRKNRGCSTPGRDVFMHA